MHIPENFVPDFTCKASTGVICNKNSAVQASGSGYFISLNNKVNLWDPSSTELRGSYGGRKHRVTSFLVDGTQIYIGYEDGCIEFIKGADISSSIVAHRGDSKLLRLHRRRVTRILKINDRLVSSSLDGTICCFDLVLDEVQHYFTGNTASVERLEILGDSKICAVCSDKSLKIWSVGNEMLEDVMAFDEHLFSAVGKAAELIVFTKSGNSYLIDLETKLRKPFEKFKHIRNVMFRDNVLCVQCQRKTAVFESTKDASLSLRSLRRFETSADFVNLDIVAGSPCFISQAGKIVTDKIHSFSFHENDIVDIKTEKSKIYTLSRDRLIVWDRLTEHMAIPSENVEMLESALGKEFMTSESLAINFSIPLRDATCFTFFCNQIVVGTATGIQVYERKFYELVSSMEIGQVQGLAACKTSFGASIGSSVHFYDSEFKEINATSVPENIVYSRFSPSGGSFLCSCLDNKIYQFRYPSLDLRIVMYGHSLPVRHFSVSPDEKLLVSCGADKLVKVWGFEFGECRKTLVGDSTSVEFLNESLFIFSDDGLQYYDTFTKLKTYRIFDPSVICCGSDYLAVASGRGLALFTMNKYEFMKDDDSEEAEEIQMKSIANPRSYDLFLHHLETLETDFSDQAVLRFYEFIADLDFNELKEYLYVVDRVSIGTLLNMLVKIIELNPLIVSRLFIQLVKNHREAVTNSELFPRIQKEVMVRIRGARDLFNTTQAQLDTEINDFPI